MAIAICIILVNWNCVKFLENRVNRNQFFNRTDCFQRKRFDPYYKKRKNRINAVRKKGERREIESKRKYRNKKKKKKESSNEFIKWNMIGNVNIYLILWICSTLTNHICSNHKKIVQIFSVLLWICCRWHRKMRIMLPPNEECIFISMTSNFLKRCVHTLAFVQPTRRYQIKWLFTKQIGRAERKKRRSLFQCLWQHTYIVEISHKLHEYEGWKLKWSPSAFNSNVIIYQGD